MTTMRRITRASAASAAAACLSLGVIGTATATAAPAPPPPAAPSAADRAEARSAAAAPETLATLSRFFARDGLARTAGAPRVEGAAVPVYTLAPDFVAGKEGAPVARLEFLASEAVAPDGRKAALWAARHDGRWQVVNIAEGDDEIRYARQGARTLPGGTVFREPQIDAWYVYKGAKVLPLDADARRAVGAQGATLDAYQDRVEQAYADKLPGSSYARKGGAGGYAESAPRQDTPRQDAQQDAPRRAEARQDGTTALLASTAGAGAALALALCAVTARRIRARAGRETG
ncbi:hypothetical protein [Streptomyces sp. PR69]|uniref:hypothetical protein n=1 Tax=Streptomyces sp. PR69 TaxID=2984950 RepID=UPI002264D388|nr:hypothetical protein [Streptomyces sp. PR69]